MPAQVKSGRWREGQLDTPLELWQCANAAEGAAEAALAARRFVCMCLLWMRVWFGGQDYGAAKVAVGAASGVCVH